MGGQVAPNPLHADALEANRAGRLTDGQRTDWTHVERDWRKNELVGALVCVVLGVVLLTGAGPSSSAVARMALGVGALVAAAFFVYRAMPGVDPLEQDLRAGRVESVEGAISKWTRSTSSRSSSSTLYFVEVAGRRFEVHALTYRAAPEAGIVRVYFLPHSHRVVNLERLPDRPLPEGALDDPRGVLADVGQAMRSHDSVQKAEAMATMEAVKDAMSARAVPPPADRRDPRPLAEAIVGTWTYGPMTVAFTADGSASATVTNQPTQSGRWSVDGDGRLHLSGMGQETTAEAWVADDHLTVAYGKEAISYRRAS